MKEYVIWGIPPGSDPNERPGLAERPLYTEAPTLAEAKRIAGILESKHGCTRTRIQVLDMSEPGESVQRMFRAAVRR